MNNPFLLADISFASHVSRKQWLIFGMLEQFTKQHTGMHRFESPSSPERWKLDAQPAHAESLCHVTPTETA